MAWCKTGVSDFSGKIFLPSKVPEFLHVLFNLVVKHSPVFFWLVCTLFYEKNEDKISRSSPEIHYATSLSNTPVYQGLLANVIV